MKEVCGENWEFFVLRVCLKVWSFNVIIFLSAKNWRYHFIDWEPKQLRRRGQQELLSLENGF